MATLENRQYFPCFAELPVVDEWLDPAYYQDYGGAIMPIRTWCFFAEIIDDSLSQMHEFFNRAEVRDISGETTSVLFGNEAGVLDFRSLRTGATLFVRYAAKCLFSDLATQVLKVNDLSMAKVIQAPLDVLLYLSQYYFGNRGACTACRQHMPAAGSISWCPGCNAAAYCSGECMQRHAHEHGMHCALCRELDTVLSCDFDRYVEPVPFR